ncbi:MAG TPA: EAL domain-containing protein [Mycobacteriales bacterium]|nr:EAL domain-containing protein [Mycobacteriales bacterium]
MSQERTPPHPTPAPRVTGRRQIIDISAALGLSCLGIYFVGVYHLAPLDSPVTLPWFVLAALFAGTDAAAIHVEFRREARSISLSEVCLVLALFVADPVTLVPARVVGSLLNALPRRQPPAKIVLDINQAALSASVAVVVFRAITGDVSTGPRSWIAAVVAAVVAELIRGYTAVAVSAASESWLRWRGWITTAGVGFTVAVFEASLALVAVVTLQADARAGWFLVLVAGVTLLAYRGYAGLDGRHANLERLYTFSRAVEEIRESGDASQSLLAHTRDLLRAAGAEVVLRDESGDGSFVRMWLDDDDSVSTSVVDAVHAESWPWPAVCADGVSRLISYGTRDPAERAHLSRYGARGVLIAPLLRDGTIDGTIAVTSRLTDVRSFDTDDQRFFEALAAHASVALENERLVTRLRQEALHDALTGLPNRTLFHHRVAEAVTAARDVSGQLAVMIMDLDRFKEVNDTLGHHNGDLLLQEIGRRLVSSLGVGTTIARLGGDEFAVLVPVVADEWDAMATANQVQSSLERPFKLEALSLDVSASIGVAIFPNHGDDPETLLQRADVAMYAAKAGTHSIETYAPESDQYSPRRLALIGELRRAIETDELALYFQPKADLPTGRVVGVEALLRWHHPQHGLLPPDEFIPLAEHTGLIRTLTQWVLRGALQQCAAWQRTGLALTMAVNISARNLLDPDLPDDVNRLLAQVGVDPALLVLEITESSVMSDPARTIGVLQRLAGMGVTISVDDFGTGYSSLAYLSRLPVQEIKIDKSFVLDMLHDRNDAVIVQTIVDLGANLGLRVVAEGVEDATTWERLTELGCAQAQGYHLSRPVPAGVLSTWLAERPPPDDDGERPGDDGAQQSGAQRRRMRRVV